MKRASDRRCLKDKSSRQNLLEELETRLRSINHRLQHEAVARAREHQLSPLAWRIVERLTRIRHPESYDGLMVHLESDKGSISSALWRLEKARLITSSRCGTCARRLVGAREHAYSLVAVERTCAGLNSATSVMKTADLEQLTGALAHIDENWPVRKSELNES